MWNEFISYTKAYIRMIDISRGKWVLAFAAGCCVLLLAFEIWQEKGRVRLTPSWIVWNILLSLEFGTILTMTLSGRELGSEYEWKLIPLWSWIEVCRGGSVDILIQILANIILFIPLGFLLPCCFAKCRRYRYTILSVAILSLTIELIQGIARIGLFEMDDIIHNTLGACIGAGLYAIVRCLRELRMKGSTLS